ncbi:2-hydroxyacid dehydrogenase [Sodaliphilus sp.]|uniref:2-hydroxyacid dehydrogenase n=1 Tax=Sodaliphilus sp. TaxID=2815818 RepID=UPI00388EDF35
MPKILHTYRYTGCPWEILKSVVPKGYTVKTLDEPTQERLIKEAADADYLLVSGRLKINKEVLDSAQNLKMIQRTGVGTDMLDKEEIKSRKIPVYVNAGVNARSVAEHTLTLILSCLKRVPAIDKQVRNGVWKKQETGTSCHELYGKTVALVGMGAIGRQVATYLHCFGAKTVYTDLFRLNEEQEDTLGATYVSSFEELLPLADILSFHCPLTDDNKEMLNASTIAKMKDEAIVVNTARGKLINESDLYEALTSGKLASAGLDVHYEEPMLKDDPLYALDNVILSPHIAGLSFETFQSMMKGAIDNIVAYDQGRLEEIEDKILKP